MVANVGGIEQILWLEKSKSIKSTTLFPRK